MTLINYIQVIILVLRNERWNMIKKIRVPCANTCYTYYE